MKYSILNSTGLCINYVTVKEGSGWQPPEGCAITEQALIIGDSYIFDTSLNKWVLVPKPVSLPFNVAADQVREQRNQLLAESDWTQLPDSPVDKTIWATYRQELRDVTEQSGFPWDVIWPTAP